jgi:hypothetical protein
MLELLLVHLYKFTRPNSDWSLKCKIEQEIGKTKEKKEKKQNPSEPAHSNLHLYKFTRPNSDWNLEFEMQNRTGN